MKKITLIVFELFMAVLTINANHAINKQERVVFILEVTPLSDSKTDSVNEEEELVAKCCLILRKRCDYMGLKIVHLETEKGTMQTNQIRVELKKVDNTERTKKLLTSSINLGFWEMYVPNEIQPLIVFANTKLSRLMADTNRDEEEIRRENPLLTLLHPEASIVRSGQIGSALCQDTATINHYLNIPEIKAIFPKDLQWKWAAINMNDKGIYSLLHAIRITEKDGKAPVGENAIKKAKNDEDYYGKACLTISMNDEGTQRWAQMTKANIGRPIAIILNGQLYAAPWVNSEITGGHSQVVGDFSKEDVQDWVCLLKSGNLPASVKVVQTILATDDESVERTK